jgi:hypothetical protein
VGYHLSGVLVLCRYSLRAVSGLQSAYLTHPLVLELCMSCHLNVLEYNIFLEDSHVHIRGVRQPMLLPETACIKVLLHWHFKLEF